MKNSLTLALVLACISTVAFAQTPTPATATVQAPTAMPMPAPVDPMKKHMDRMFDEMDANHDGVITREESIAFSNKKFDERDTNHDGKVTRAEWDAFNEQKMKEMQERMGKMQGMGQNGMGGMPQGMTPPQAPAMNAAKPIAPIVPATAPAAK